MKHNNETFTQFNMMQRETVHQWNELGHQKRYPRAPRAQITNDTNRLIPDNCKVWRNVKKPPLTSADVNSILIAIGGRSLLLLWTPLCRSGERPRRRAGCTIRHRLLSSPLSGEPARGRFGATWLVNTDDTIVAVFLGFSRYSSLLVLKPGK